MLISSTITVLGIGYWVLGIAYCVLDIGYYYIAKLLNCHIVKLLNTRYKLFQRSLRSLCSRMMKKKEGTFKAWF